MHLAILILIGEDTHLRYCHTDLCVYVCVSVTFETIRET